MAYGEPTFSKSRKPRGIYWVPAHPSVHSGSYTCKKDAVKAATLAAKELQDTIVVNCPSGEVLTVSPK